MNSIQKKFVKDPRWKKVADATKQEAILKNVNKDKLGKLKKVINFGKEAIKGDNWEIFNGFKEELRSYNKKYNLDTGYDIILEKPRTRSTKERIVKEKIKSYAINHLGYTEDEIYSNNLTECLSFQIKPTSNRTLTKEERIKENEEIADKLTGYINENLHNFVKELTSSKRDFHKITKRIKAEEYVRKFWVTEILCDYREELDELFPNKKVSADLKEELNNYIIDKAELEVKNAVQIRFTKIIKDKVEDEVLLDASDKKLMDEILDENPISKPRVEIRSEKAPSNIRDKTEERNKKIAESRSIPTIM